jgi:hypothetical protein
MVIRALCRLLPEGFRARQGAEWTGDLVALSPSGSGTRWRYLLAAAWTLPALRAHAGKAAVDRPPTMVAPSLPVTTLTRVVLVGLGLPVLAWLIAVPLRYYLLDVPARIAPYSHMPFDPKDLWPMDGPFILLVPLWVLLGLGAWAMMFDWMLVAWVGMAAAVLGSAQRGAGWKHRLASSVIGAAIAIIAIAGFRTRQELGPVFSPEPGKGLTAVALGGIAVIIGLGVRGVSGRSRIAMVLAGLIAIAIFAWHQTPTGLAMIYWYMD